MSYLHCLHYLHYLRYLHYLHHLTIIHQVVEAARQGAQIILLPEDGIHGYGQVTRETLRWGNGELVITSFIVCEADL